MKKLTKEQINDVIKEFIAKKQQENKNILSDISNYKRLRELLSNDLLKNAIKNYISIYAQYSKDTQSKVDDQYLDNLLKELNILCDISKGEKKEYQF